MTRRLACGHLAALAAGFAVGAAEATGAAGDGIANPEASPRFEDRWADWAGRFVRDGRVTDTGNAGISHSEGQGTGMLGAVEAGDRPAFDRLWQWTRETLRLDETGLFAWRYEPGAGVTDVNNASDGDVMIAWALLRAAVRWDAPEHLQDGRAIAAALRRHAFRQVGRHVLLLPGRSGFVSDAGVVVNPSYAVLPAFAALAAADQEAAWTALARGMAALVEAARFGRHELPPDWLLVDPGWRGRRRGLSPAPAWPPHFGFDAIRVPLYLAWAGGGRLVLSRFVRFWDGFTGERIPAWVDLESGDLSGYAAPPGFDAVRALCAARLAGEAPVLPPPGEDDYYSASLALLAAMAGRTA